MRKERIEGFEDSRAQESKGEKYEFLMEKNSWQMTASRKKLKT